MTTETRTTVTEIFSIVQLGPVRESDGGQTRASSGAWGTAEEATGFLLENDAYFAGEHWAETFVERTVITEVRTVEKTRV